jgi:hypothetical protein
VEPGAELEQRRDAATRDDLALGRLEDPADALEQRGLARPVVAEQRHRLALRDGEAHVA